jgi:hypothetical protein
VVLSMTRVKFTSVPRRSARIKVSRASLAGWMRHDWSQLVIATRRQIYPLGAPPCRCSAHDTLKMDTDGLAQAQIGAQEGRSSPINLPYCTGHINAGTQALQNHSSPSITASDGSNDTALAILSRIVTPSSLLFDPQFTTRKRPSALPPFRTFPPSPTLERYLPQTVPSTISIQNLDIEDSISDMDKRHPSSFQQLEKLGEGTYATVCSNFISSEV